MKNSKFSFMIVAVAFIPFAVMAKSEVSAVVFGDQSDASRGQVSPIGNDSFGTSQGGINQPRPQRPGRSDTPPPTDDFSNNRGGDLRTQIFGQGDKIAKAIDIINQGLNKTQAGLGNMVASSLKKDIAQGLIVIEDARTYGQGRFFAEIEETATRNDFVIAVDHEASEGELAHTIAMYYQHVANHRNILNRMNHDEALRENVGAGRDLIQDLKWLQQNGVSKQGYVLEKEELSSLFQYLATAYFDKIAGLSLNQKLTKAGVKHPNSATLMNDKRLAKEVADAHIFQLNAEGMAWFSDPTSMGQQQQSGPQRDEMKDYLLRLIRFSNYDYQRFITLLNSDELKDQFLKEFARSNGFRVFGVNERPMIAERGLEERYLDEEEFIEQPHRFRNEYDYHQGGGRRPGQSLNQSR